MFLPSIPSGLAHEHQRIDRDKYIKVMLENVFESHEHNFILDKNTTTFGVNNFIQDCRFGIHRERQNGIITLLLILLLNRFIRSVLLFCSYLRCLTTTVLFICQMPYN